MIKGFFRSLRRLSKGYHVAHNLNPLAEKTLKPSPNRAERREEEKYLRKKYKTFK